MFLGVDSFQRPYQVTIHHPFDNSPIICESTQHKKFSNDVYRVPIKVYKCTYSTTLHLHQGKPATKCVFSPPPPKKKNIKAKKKNTKKHPRRNARMWRECCNLGGKKKGWEMAFSVSWRFCQCLVSKILGLEIHPCALQVWKDVFLVGFDSPDFRKAFLVFFCHMVLWRICH